MPVVTGRCGEDAVAVVGRAAPAGGSAALFARLASEAFEVSEPRVDSGAGGTGLRPSVAAWEVVAGRFASAGGTAVAAVLSRATEVPPPGRAPVPPRFASETGAAGRFASAGGTAVAAVLSRATEV
ncbi:hypothetical protein ABZX30_32320, partial [Streptomyces sp. NPDC004542]